MKNVYNNCHFLQNMYIMKEYQWLHWHKLIPNFLHIDDIQYDVAEIPTIH